MGGLAKYRKVGTDDMWSDDCPSRGPGLAHAHWRQCVPQAGHPGTGERHEWSQCCHCGQQAGFPPDSPVTPPPLDVDARLRQLGLLPPLEDFPFSVVRTDLPVPEEPRLAQGVYPGPSWGPGRGDLTPRQKAALVARIGWVMWLRARSNNGT